MKPRRPASKSARRARISPSSRSSVSSTPTIAAASLSSVVRARSASSDAHGDARQVEVTSEQVAFITQGSYSTCDPRAPEWVLYADDVELDKVGDFEEALQSYMSSSHAELMSAINSDPVFNDEVEAKLKAAADDFKANHAW